MNRFAPIANYNMTKCFQSSHGTSLFAQALACVLQAGATVAALEIFGP